MSSEWNDMNSTQAGSPAQKRSSKTTVIPQQDQTARRQQQPPQPHVAMAQAARGALRCVWTGHLHDDHRCGASIPASAVVEAWRIQKEASSMSEGFFRFTWGGGTWLGYGLPDGRVRGTYCPTHTAERDARAQNPAQAAAAPGAGPEVAVRRSRPLSLVK